MCVVIVDVTAVCLKEVSLSACGTDCLDAPCGIKPSSGGRFVTKTLPKSHKMHKDCQVFCNALVAANGMS